MEKLIGNKNLEKFMHELNFVKFFFFIQAMLQKYEIIDKLLKIQSNKTQLKLILM